MSYICTVNKFDVILLQNYSPSKIDQWSKPRPAAKLVLLLARRSPLMLKERAGGSMRTAIAVYDIDYQLILHNHTPPPCGQRLLQKCDKRCSSPSKIEGAGGSMSTPALPYSSD